jgi:ribosome-associated protein
LKLSTIRSYLEGCPSVLLRDRPDHLSGHEGVHALIANTQGRAAAPRAKAIVPPAPHLADAEADALVGLITESLDDSKAEDIVVIDLRGKTSLADHMIIATGRSDRHVGAIAEHIIAKLRNDGRGTPRVEGMPHCDWVLVDANDVIIHVFRGEVRQFYNLEKMWGVDRPDEQASRSA